MFPGDNRWLCQCGDRMGIAATGIGILNVQNKLCLKGSRWMSRLQVIRGLGFSVLLESSCGCELCPKR